MNTNKEAKKYLNKYFKAQYINENDDEFKSLVRLLNKAQQQGKKLNTPDVSVEKQRICDCSKQVGSLHLPTNEFTCWNCGKITKETER